MSQNDPIPFADLAAQHASIAHELRAAFERVVGSSGFILGEEVDRFEDEFAAYCGTSHCVGLASGTAALTVMLIAAGIGPGDEVIVPAHTFIATALAVLHAGATPVLCDVADGTGLLDVASAEACVREHTAAIVAVHLYGQTCDAAPLRDLAERHGLALFEDAAQAHGAVDGGRRAGALGRAAAFSFYPSKNLGALGDGGAITTDDAELAARARRLRNLGQQSKDDHVEPGFNERLDGLQAAFLRVKLAHLDDWNELRRWRARSYREALPPSVRPLEERDRDACVYHLFPVRVAAREDLRAKLREGGVETGIHYSPALHEQPALAGRHLRPVELRNAESWAAAELSLPLYPELTDAQISQIAGICAS